MMSILEYAQDVNKSVEEIFRLCDKLGISYEDENTDLSEDDIVLLDGEVDNVEEIEEIDEEIANDYAEEEEIEERVEKIISDAKIDIDTTVNKQKLKSKQDRQESSKIKFQKERKELYKHREN